AFFDPTNGSTTVNLTQPLTWSSVSGAQAYYLYVGTTLGANNVVNSGEIQATSYQPGPLQLPAGPTLYARVYTKLNGLWYASADITFSGMQRATLTAPTDGSTTVDLTRPLSWTAITGAQAYYLYVGTTVGAHNIVDSGAIQTTSYQPG